MSEKPSNKVELFVTPESYFQDLVREGFTQRKIQTFPMAEKYLVHLLQHYLDTKNLFESEYSETGERNPQTLAEAYLLAQNAEHTTKVEMLRKLGDRALYISGFFGDSLARKVVDIDYYAKIGGSAYAHLAHCTREDTLAKVFQTFSKRFLDFVEVLAYISHRSLVKSDQSILRLYDRYLRTGSEADRDKLIEMGVLTVVSGQLKLGKQS